MTGDQYNEIIFRLDSLQVQLEMLNYKLDRTHYTPTEAARVWKVSRRTVDRWIKSGKVRTLDVPGSPKISVEEVIRVRRELI